MTILSCQVNSILSDKCLKSPQNQLSKVYGWVGGGGTIDYSVTPGPYLGDFVTELNFDSIVPPESSPS